MKRLSLALVALVAVSISAAAFAETPAKRSPAAANGLNCIGGKYHMQITTETANTASGAMSVGRLGVGKAISFKCQTPRAQPRICCDIPALEWECSSEGTDAYTFEVYAGGLANIPHGTLTQQGTKGARTLTCQAD